MATVSIARLKEVDIDSLTGVGLVPVTSFRRTTCRLMAQWGSHAPLTAHVVRALVTLSPILSRKGVLCMASFLQRVVSFSGRANRSEFWLTLIGLGVISFIVGYIFEAVADAQDLTVMQRFLTGIVLSLPIVVCGYAMLARRWHDRGKSGWFSLISFVPYLGGLWILIELGFFPGKNETNKYGPKPTGLWQGGSPV